MKVWSLFVAPYNKTAFTLVLKMQTLVILGSAVEFQMGRRMLKARVALLMQLLMSSSAPPSLPTTLPN